MSIFKQREQQVQVLLEELEVLESGLAGQSGDQAKAKLDEVIESAASIRVAADGYMKKVSAGEKDPNRKIYGPAMVEKINKMVKELGSVEEKIGVVKDSVGQVLEKERIEREKLEAEAAKKRAAEEEERKRLEAIEAAAEEERLRKVAEEEEKLRQERERVEQEKACAKAEAEKQATSQPAAHEATTADKAAGSEGSTEVMVKLTVHHTSGAAVMVGPVSVESTVVEIKKALRMIPVRPDGRQIPDGQQRLILEGHFLRNDVTLKDSGITSDCTLFLVELPPEYRASEREDAVKTTQDTLAEPPAAEDKSAPAPTVDTPMEEETTRDESMEVFTVSIKSMTSTVTVEAQPHWTASELRSAAQKSMGPAAEFLSFVFKGKVLKPADTLESLGIKSGQQIYAMEKKAPSTASAATPAQAEATPVASTPVQAASRAAPAAPSAAPVAAPSTLSAPSGKVHKVTRGKPELDEILEACGSLRLAVVDFSASWCGPCKAIAPALEMMAAEFPDVSFVGVDSETSRDNSKLFEEMSISSMPTFHYYVNGRQVHSVLGARKSAIHEGVLLFRGTVEDGGTEPVEPPPGGMTAAVMQSLRLLKRAASEEHFNVAVSTLISYVSNAIKSPGEEKYRKIRYKNNALQTRVARFQGGLDCLHAFGFRKETVGGEEYLILSEADARNPVLQQVNTQLQTAFQGAGSQAAGSATSAAAAAPAPEPTAAPTPAAVAAPAQDQQDEADDDAGEDEQALLERAIRLSLQEYNNDQRQDGSGASQGN